MAIDYNTIGQRLAKIRREKGLSQDNLAEKAELSSNYLSHIENFRSIPSLETVLKLCDALDITPNELLLGIEDTQKDYLQNDISEKIARCNSEQRLLINDFIDMLLKRQIK